MSEEEQVAAIGRAVQAADASSKKLKTLAAEIHDSCECFKSVAEALREIILKSPEMRIHDLQSALKKAPGADGVLALVAEYEETARQAPALQERARTLRGLG